MKHIQARQYHESDGREEEAFHDRQEPLRLAKVTAHKPAIRYLLNVYTRYS